jgi:hypothetical protein
MHLATLQSVSQASRQAERPLQPRFDPRSAALAVCMITLRFVPFHFVPGNFVPVISSFGHFVPSYLVPFLSRLLLQFVPRLFRPLLSHHPLSFPMCKIM